MEKKPYLYGSLLLIVIGLLFHCRIFKKRKIVAMYFLVIERDSVCIM